MSEIEWAFHLVHLGLTVALFFRIESLKTLVLDRLVIPYMETRTKVAVHDEAIKLLELRMGRIDQQPGVILHEHF